MKTIVFQRNTIFGQRLKTWTHKCCMAPPNNCPFKRWIGRKHLEIALSIKQIRGTSTCGLYISQGTLRLKVKDPFLDKRHPRIVYMNR